MKNNIFLILIAAAVVLLASGCATPAAVEPSPSPQEATPVVESTALGSDLPAAVGKLHWFGISAILYHGSKNIYFDPVTLAGNLPPADIILISHAHSDHADMDSLKQILTSGTVLIISPNVAGFYESHKDEIGVPAIILDEGQSTNVGGITIRAVPAYDDQIHFRSSKGMGFVVSVDGERIYFAGGTRVYPEMAQIESDVTLYPWYRNADVLAAAEILKTKVLIPIHAGASGVKAFVDVYSKQVTRLKIIALVPGPYNP
jgi:L-ascorbate metabolism protein UlaG (beta-lactamase superfamily)